jgi:hypothetical protein
VRVTPPQDRGVDVDASRDTDGSTDDRRGWQRATPCERPWIARTNSRKREVSCLFGNRFESARGREARRNGTHRRDANATHTHARARATRGRVEPQTRLANLPHRRSQGLDSTSTQGYLQPGTRPATKSRGTCTGKPKRRTHADYQERGVRGRRSRRTCTGPPFVGRPRTYTDILFYYL